jgi:hypothetical protein
MQSRWSLIPGLFTTEGGNHCQFVSGFPRSRVGRLTAGRLEPVLSNREAYLICFCTIGSRRHLHMDMADNPAAANLTDEQIFFALRRLLYFGVGVLKL